MISTVSNIGFLFRMNSNKNSLAIIAGKGMDEMNLDELDDMEDEIDEEEERLFEEYRYLRQSCNTTLQ